MDVLHEGWLTKSPPEKSKWKVFKAKWRRRWFVLHERTSESFPGVGAALDYFKDNTRKVYLGSIDLNQCDEVLSSLDSSVYRHLFALSTKHKSHSRTYYLATDTEREMNNWVDCLCQVLGLKENNDPPEQENQSQDSIQQAQPVSNRGSGYMAVQQSPASQPQQYGSQNLASSQTSLPRQDPTDHGTPVRRNSRTEAYIDLGECYSGDPQAAKEENPALPRKGETRDLGAPTLDTVYNVPPTFDPNPSTPQLDYINMPQPDQDDIYKVPPPAHRDDNENDVYKVPPSHSAPYHHHHDDDDDSLYKVPPVNHQVFKNTDSLYNVPPPRQLAPPPGGDDQDVYDVPPVAPHGGGRAGRTSVSSSGSRHSPPPPPRAPSQDIYDIPPPPHASSMSPGNRDSTYDVPPMAGFGGGSHQDIYDAPPPRQVMPSGGVKASLQEVVPPPRPRKASDNDGAITESRYINLPSAQADYMNKKHVPPPSHMSGRSTLDDDTYDFPPTATGRHDNPSAGVSPPPPCPTAVANKAHKYVNGPPGIVNAVPPPGGCRESGLPLYIPMANNQPSNSKDLLSRTIAPPAPDGSPRDSYIPMNQGRDSTVSTDSTYTVMASGGGRESIMRFGDPDSASSQMTAPPMMRAIPRQEEAGQMSPPTISHRTRSFKRHPDSLPPPPSSPKHTQVLLPTRKPTVGDASSSDDDSDSDEEDGDHRPYRPKLPQAGGLNSKPPPPKPPKGEVEYLDLDHSTSQGDQQAVCSSPLASPGLTGTRMGGTLPTGARMGGTLPRGGNTSPTEYKEIDFVKTQALSETKKIVENKRKSSEKSIDD